MRIALIVLLCLGCAKREPWRGPIILISVDTLRSDRLPSYGYAKGQTPNIDALRRDAVLYERAYSHCPLTLPSHTSMLTGLLPTEHGVRNNIGYRFDAAKHRTLAKILREKGYRTGAAVSSYVLRSETGIADGFDVYDDITQDQNQRSGFETLKKARAFIKADPFFLFFHIYEPHAPYEAPEPFRSRVADAYDAEIATADAVVGELIASLKNRGVYDDALIVFTSDHGEALWEHGEDQHGILLYREVLQVPLIIKYPKGDRAGTSVPEPFGLRNIYDVMLGSKPQPNPLYSETLYPRIHLGWSDLRSLIDGNYHYIESSSPELYDLARDPGEKTNLVSTERRVASSMRRTLETFPRGNTALGAIDAEEAKKLAALGYLGTPRERSGPLPNPREEIGTLLKIKDAFQLAADHKNDDAIAAMRVLLEKNPALTDVSTRLAEVFSEEGRYLEAIDVYKAAIARQERFSPDLAIVLAIAYLKAERPREAAAHAQLALKTHPFEANEVLARVALGEQRYDDAFAHIQAAAFASNNHPRTDLLLVDLQKKTGDLALTLRTLSIAERRASEMGIAQQGIDHERGDILARLDRPVEAIAAYEREIARFPHHLQSYANLAIIHHIEGRQRESDAVLEKMVRANPTAQARALAKRTRDAFRS